MTATDVSIFVSMVTAAIGFTVGLITGRKITESKYFRHYDEQKRKALKTIADNQLAIGGVDPLTDYEQGQWDGMEAAYEILLDEWKVDG